MVRDDLRDSPFRKRAIHLTDYLRGTRGRAWIDAAAAASGTPPKEIEQLIVDLVPVELVVPRVNDRVRWAGTDDIVLYSSSMSIDRRPLGSRVQAFNVSGGRVEIALSAAEPKPFMLIQPITRNFGRDPEANRAKGRRRTGNTVSDVPTEIGIMSHCDAEDPSLCCTELSEECDTEPGTGVIEGGTTLPSTYTWYYCIGAGTGLPSGSDMDNDGLRDDCEYQLAYAFRPHLAMNGSDEAPEHEPYYSVKRITTSPDATVGIFYALSYYRDPGDPFGTIEAHDGDSEFIVLEVRPAADSRYVLSYATLSSHWNAPYDADHTARYQYMDLEYPSEYRGRPRVWVSWNKHANYRSRAVCDDMWNDTCDTFYTSTVYRDAEIIPSANLGNNFNTGTEQPSSRLIDCTGSRYAQVYGLYGTECHWRLYYFYGWHYPKGQAASGTYRYSLEFWSY